MPSYLGQYLVARALNPVLAASAFHLTFCVNSHAQMDDEDLFLIAVYCLVLSFGHSIVSPAILMSVLLSIKRRYLTWTVGLKKNNVA